MEKVIEEKEKIIFFTLYSDDEGRILWDCPQEMRFGQVLMLMGALETALRYYQRQVDDYYDDGEMIPD